MRKHEEILSTFEESLSQNSDLKKVVEEILEFAILYGDSYGEKLTPLLEKAVNLSKKIGFETGEVLAYYHIFFFQDMTQGPWPHFC